MKGIRTLCVGLSIAMAACSDSASESAASGSPDGGIDGGGARVACDDDGGIDLDGTWALLARYSLRLASQVGGAVTMCPEDQVAPAYLLVVLDIESNEDTLSSTAIACDLELPGVTAMVGDCRPEQSNLLGVEIPIPDALQRAFGQIPPVTAGGRSNSENAVVFDPMRFTWGTRQDALPSWQAGVPGCGLSDFDVGRTTACEADCVESCEDVVDDDADGYPGVTVHVCGRTSDDDVTSIPCNAEEPTTPGVTLQGKVAMAIRTELVLNGVMKSSCEVSGSFGSETTYAVLGADAYLANTRISVASALQSLPLFEGIKEASLWRMVRVDGRHGASDWALPQDAGQRCAIVRSKRNELE